MNVDAEEFEAAWGAVHDALPAGWTVRQPSYYPERREWQQYAFDSFEKPSVGARSRDGDRRHGGRLREMPAACPRSALGECRPRPCNNTAPSSSTHRGRERWPRLLDDSG
jgi:hypothetical protein